MNLHTTQIQRRTESKRSRTTSRRSNRSFKPVLRIIALLLVVFLLASARAVINSEVEKLNRQAVNLKSKLHDLNREIASMEIQRERYLGRYILDQIKRLDMKLCYPKAGQVRKLRVPVTTRDDLEKTSMDNLLLSQR